MENVIRYVASAVSDLNSGKTMWMCHEIYSKIQQKIVMKNLSMRQMQSTYYDIIITSWTVGSIKKEMLIC